MTRAVALTSDADADVADAVDWYDAQQPGRGDQFLEELQRHLTRVAGMPELYGEVATGKRAAPLPYSQYVTYYRVEPDRIVVLAVQHERADPRRWLRRR